MKAFKLVSLMILVLSGTAFAAEISVSRERGGGRAGHSFPGSYRQTCANIYATPRVLEADCKDRSGRYVHTYLEDPRLCSDDIRNHNGQLFCNKEHERVPEGSFRSTCNNESVYRGTLSADCKTRSGERRHSILQYFYECRGDIANDDGYLVCD